MGGEPWCFTESQVALMTDEQIDARVKYAVDQAKAAKNGDMPNATPQDPFPDGLPDCDTYVTRMMQLYPGKTREHWESAWRESRENLDAALNRE